jgi:hypothetical protein
MPLFLSTLSVAFLTLYNIPSRALLPLSHSYVRHPFHASILQLTPPYSPVFTLFPLTSSHPFQPVTDYYRTESFHCVEIEVLTAMVTNSSIFWDIKPCSSLKANRCFEGACYLHLQGQKVSQARNQCEVGCKCYSGDFQ